MEIMIRKDIIDLFRVPVGKKLRLKDHNPAEADRPSSKTFGKDALKGAGEGILDQNLADLLRHKACSRGQPATRC